MFKRIKKLLVGVLAATMLFSLNTSLAFAQSNTTDNVDSNASARLSFIGETSGWMKSDPNAWTEYTLNLPSAVSELTVQTMVHDPGNLDAYYQWQIKLPGSIFWQDLELMCKADNSIVHNYVINARSGNYKLRVRQTYGGTNSTNKYATVTFYQ